MRLDMYAKTCSNCGRARTSDHHHAPESAWIKAAYIYATHDYYGCDTGCCGFVLHAEDERGHEISVSEFDFMHVDSREELEMELRNWATDHGRPDVPIDWERCETDRIISC